MKVSYYFENMENKFRSEQKEQPLLGRYALMAN